jgi:hypothetical protein
MGWKLVLEMLDSPSLEGMRMIGGAKFPSCLTFTFFIADSKYSAIALTQTEH